ncbi:MAG: 3-hydroxyacyl-CoA dehydrogenase [Oscillospiraceae bacterium]|nr:3-hydroxyacyl-CoA dehydrogenase [Oscillospiraceae bacterium]
MKVNRVKHIGIIGTGMIATSMAVLTTGHGYKTTMFAVNDDLAAASKKTFEDFYAQLVEKKLMTAGQSEICGKYLNYTQDYKGMADADIIFECVVEVLDVKHAVYSEIETNCPNVKAICSVSSALVADKLAEGMGKYKDRIIVTHPFNPPHMVPYFELAAGAETADGVVEFAKSVLEALDRKPVVLKKSAPGFIGNRLQFALWREALYIVENGIADPKDIDTCLMYSFCPRYTSIGMFDHFDNGGLDLNINVCKTLFPDLSDTKEVPKAITDRISRGDLGQKTGVGFYDWRNVDMDAYREKVSAPYWNFFNWELPTE